MPPNPTFYEPIARFYDAENAEMTEDLALYSAVLAEYGGPVLDVGCGTGRVMLHLATEGARVVGIDRSRLCWSAASASSPACLTLSAS